MQAEDLCKKILGLSEAIMEASILDNQGFVLIRRARNPSQSKYEPTADSYKKYGTWVKLTFSIAQETDSIFGSTEYVTIAHKNFKHAAVPLPQQSGFVAMVLDRTADVERIASLIQSITPKTKTRTPTESLESPHQARKAGTSY